MKLLVELPWPDRRLSQNARVHWRVRARETKIARATAKLAGMLAMRKAKWPKGLVTEAITQITFFDPVKRRRDRDNHQAMCKAYCDGLADAGVIKDDCGFTHRPVQFAVGPKRCITIEIESMEADHGRAAA